MKLTTGILAMAVMVGGSAATKAVAQNPDAIDNARSAAKSVASVLVKKSVSSAFAN